MRQRVARVAGSLAIESEPGGGTAISARVPAIVAGPADGRAAPMTPPIRLLIVDDHPVVRDGLRGMFSGDPEFEVVGEAADGAEALALVGTPRPGRDPDGPPDAGHGRRGRDPARSPSSGSRPACSS